MSTFETIGEPDYTAELVTDADAGILLSKDWFEWADKSKPLAAGTLCRFRLCSEVTYKDKVNYCSVSRSLLLAMSQFIFILAASLRLLMSTSSMTKAKGIPLSPISNVVARQTEQSQLLYPL
jgi:hypothetical protein